MKNQIISATSSSPILGLVYNCPTAAYLICMDSINDPSYKIPQNKWSDVVRTILLDDSRNNSLPQRLAAVGVVERSPMALFSLALPVGLNFIYGYTRDTDSKKIVVRITNGVLHDGILVKGALDRIIQTIHKRFGSEFAVRFISEAQFILDWYLEFRGFSIGLADCIASDIVAVRRDVKVEIAKIRNKVDSARESTSKSASETEKFFKEAEINKYLSQIKGVGLHLAAKDMNPDNALSAMVMSGAKGSLMNIAQIAGALGEQFIMGKTPSRVLYGDRALGYYEANDNSIEANGFITSSFSDGMKPSEILFHMASSREGLLATAMRTADVGKIAHDISKVLENTFVDYKNAVVNTAGVYTSLSYGYGCENLLKVTSFSSTGEVFMPFDLDNILLDLEQEENNI